MRISPGGLGQDHPAQRADPRGRGARRFRGAAVQVHLREGVGGVDEVAAPPRSRSRAGPARPERGHRPAGRRRARRATSCKPRSTGCSRSWTTPSSRRKAGPRSAATAVRKIANEIFDFGETARRSLGRHWQPRTPAERDEFVQLFSDLLERSYISKVELYGGEKIQYVGRHHRGRPGQGADQAGDQERQRDPDRVPHAQARVTAGSSTTSSSRA